MIFVILCFVIVPFFFFFFNSYFFMCDYVISDFGSLTVCSGDVFVLPSMSEE